MRKRINIQHRQWGGAFCPDTVIYNILQHKKHYSQKTAGMEGDAA